MTVIVLTPPLASAYLDTNHGPLNQGLVDAYVRAMQDRKFLDVSTIQVSPSGKLLDGRHRCSAVVPVAGRAAATV